MSNQTRSQALALALRKGHDPRLLQILQGLGLSMHEAIVYSTLVSLGPSPARDISRSSALAREHCYEVLRKLEVKGLVKVELSDLSTYVAVEPRAAVRLFVSSLDARFAALRDSAYEAGAWLEVLSTGAPKSRRLHMHPVPQIQLVFGKRTFLEFEKELDACRVEYMGVISPQTLAISRGLRILDALERTAKRGVKVRVLTGILPIEGRDRLGGLLKRLKARRNAMAGEGPRFSVFDRARAMQPMHGPAVGDEERESILTGNPTVVNGLTIYFEHLWRNSTPLSRRG